VAGGQDVAQHTPPMHAPLAHCIDSVHGPPASTMGSQAPFTQVEPAAQSVMEVQVVGQPVAPHVIPDAHGAVIAEHAPSEHTPGS